MVAIQHELFSLLWSWAISFIIVDLFIFISQIAEFNDDSFAFLFAAISQRLGLL